MSRHGALQQLLVWICTCMTLWVEFYQSRIRDTIPSVSRWLHHSVWCWYYFCLFLLLVFLTSCGPRWFPAVYNREKKTQHTNNKQSKTWRLKLLANTNKMADSTDSVHDSEVPVGTWVSKVNAVFGEKNTNLLSVWLWNYFFLTRCVQWSMEYQACYCWMMRK